MTTDYLTWEDLLDAEEPPAPAPGGSAPPAPLPETLRDFLAEYDRLRQELDRRVGAAPPTPEESRLALMYPVKAHTPESRIEERQLRRRDEAQAVLKRQALAARRIETAQLVRELAVRTEAFEEIAHRQRQHAAWVDRQTALAADAAARRRAEERLQARLDQRNADALAERNVVRAETPGRDRNAKDWDAKDWDAIRERRREQHQETQRIARRSIRRDGGRTAHG